MSIFDKEIIINGKAVRSPEQQVYKNMKDIEELQAKIKPVFLTSEDLTSSSVSIATSDTNIGDATEGWLITGNALLFRIDGNDGSTVLLTYSCDLNGPVGPTPVITAAATVGDQVGTPAVTVVKTGTDENPLFTFNFTNLKGEPGDNLITVQVVDSLPATGTPGILYFVANSSGESQNAYDEYIYNNGSWEKLGQAQIDLSNYIQKSNTSGLVKNDGTIDTTAYTTLNLVYPVGSIYMSVNNTNPSTLFGGTWAQLKDRFLLGAGDTYNNGDTGGNATHNHTLDNGYAMFSPRETGGYAYAYKKNVSSYLPNKKCETADIYENFSEWTVASATALGGSTDNGNNMPPYLVVYMWKRTA